MIVVLALGGAWLLALTYFLALFVVIPETRRRHRAHRLVRDVEKHVRQRDS